MFWESCHVECQELPVNWSFHRGVAGVEETSFHGPFEDMVQDCLLIQDTSPEHLITCGFRFGRSGVCQRVCISNKRLGAAAGVGPTV